MAGFKFRDKLYFMSPNEAAEEYDSCTCKLEYLYSKLALLQNRKKQLTARIDSEIDEVMQDINNTISLRNAINDAHFATEEYRDIKEITFDDIT